jgi:hypothetical protein
MHSREDPSRVITAERNAALGVAHWQIKWRNERCRQRIPHVETEKMIAAAIKLAARSFNILEHMLSRDNIWRLLKQGKLVELARNVSAAAR